MKSENKRGLQIKERKVWVVRIVFKSEVVALESHIQHKRQKERKSRRARREMNE